MSKEFDNFKEDKRVYDPRLNKFIPAIIYIGIADESPVNSSGLLDGQLSIGQ